MNLFLVKCGYNVMMSDDTYSGHNVYVYVIIKLSCRSITVNKVTAASCLI